MPEELRVLHSCILLDGHTDILPVAAAAVAAQAADTSAVAEVRHWEEKEEAIRSEATQAEEHLEEEASQQVAARCRQVKVVVKPMGEVEAKRCSPYQQA
jgi:hypothetical protein